MQMQIFKSAYIMFLHNFLSQNLSSVFLHSFDKDAFVPCEADVVTKVSFSDFCSVVLIKLPSFFCAVF